MSGIAERLAEVLRDHGIYGFNGSQVACRCSPRNWRAVLDWHAHVAEIQAELVEREIAAARGEALREAAQEARERGDIAQDDGPEVWDWLEGIIRRAALSSEPDRGEGEGRTCACGSLLLSTTASERHDRGLHGPAHCIGTQARVWGQS